MKPFIKKRVINKDVNFLQDGGRGSVDRRGKFSLNYQNGVKIIKIL